MNGPYPGDPQAAQWRRPVVDPSLPPYQPAAPSGYPPPPTATAMFQPPQPPYPVAAPRPGDGLAISSLVLGIVSVSLGWIPLCGIVSLAPGIIGVVLGSLGLQSPRHRYLSLAGIILSVIGIALSVMIFL